MNVCVGECVCARPHIPSLGCHYSMFIDREVIVGQKAIRWAGQRIIEVMIGAVQRQLIAMESGLAARKDPILRSPPLPWEWHTEYGITYTQLTCVRQSLEHTGL